MSAGYDSKVNILDVRTPDQAIKIKVPKTSKDIESGVWHPTLEHNFALSTESGIVLGYDTRKPDQAIFNI